MTVTNRFTDMFAKTGVTERKSKTKRTVDFGESLANDEGINATFRSLHETGLSPSVSVQPVNVDKPVVQPVIVVEPIIEHVVAPDLPVDSVPDSVEPQTIDQSTNQTGSQPFIQPEEQNIPLDRVIVLQLDGNTVKPIDHKTDRQLNHITVSPIDSV